MIQEFKSPRKDDEIRVQMDITVDLPAEVAEQAERLGIYEFERCVFNPDTCRMTASVPLHFIERERSQMKKSLYLIAGILIGITLFGGSSVLAAGITAERSTNRIYVNGQEVHLTAYNINGNNYVMLRDVGKTVGFEVYWDGDAKCVQIESEKPYTGEAPVTSAEAKPVEQPAQTDVAAAKQDIIDRTNALRKENGVAALRVNDKLMQAAQVRADEMAASGVYSHTRPDGRKSNTVTDSKYTGENLHNISELYLEQQHKTLSEAVVELWSNSRAHADNMTSSRYGEIGVGLARGIDKDGFDCWYCVQVFLLDGCEVTWVDTPVMK